MDKKEWMKGVSLADVLKALDARAPDWAMRLADQQDFKDALRLDVERGRELLRYRASEKVGMVVGACVEAVLEKEEKTERSTQRETVWMLEEERRGKPGANCWALLPYVFAAEEVARASWKLSWRNVPENQQPLYEVKEMQVYTAPKYL